MLIYFATREHLSALDNFLRLAGDRLRDRVRVVPYEEASSVRFNGVATVIFANYDALSDADRAGFGALHDALSARGIRVLNHPLRSPRRAELLPALHAVGINQFRVMPLAQVSAARFPLFLRFANRHNGPQTPLLYDQEQLDNAIRVGQRKGVATDDMLVVEFCSTKSEQAEFRLHSAMCIAGDVLPRHLFVSREWVVRRPGLLSMEIITEEQQYLEHNPHARFIRAVFERAGIGYGRIDYSMLAGKPQVWEIDPNPTLLEPAEHYRSDQVPNQRWFATRALALFEKLALPLQA